MICQKIPIKLFFQKKTVCIFNLEQKKLLKIAKVIKRSWHLPANKRMASPLLVMKNKLVSLIELIEFSNVPLSL